MKVTRVLVASAFILLAIACKQEKQKEHAENPKDMEQLSSKNYNTFKVSDGVEFYQVRFKNQFKMEVVGHLFIPKHLDRNARHAAIIVGHPMGAVKEQSADIYASNMADKGFITLAIDLSFWGESQGEPRNSVAPDIYAEDFSAAVDFLGTRPFIDREKIGVLGIFGSGSFVISAAKIDPRMKAIATVSMYDMGAANRDALNHSQTIAQRKQIIADAVQQRYAEFTGDQAHSKEFSEDAYKRAAQPKELYYVKGAGHVDLYDKTDLIPFDKLTLFFKTHLK